MSIMPRYLRTACCHIYFQNENSVLDNFVQSFRYQKIERFRITFTAHSRNDHVTMLTPGRSLSSVSVKLSSFASVSKVELLCTDSHICTKFFKKTSTRSHVCRERNSKSL